VENVKMATVLRPNICAVKILRLNNHGTMLKVVELMNYGLYSEIVTDRGVQIYTIIINHCD
jgi:hypothetical protein